MSDINFDLLRRANKARALEWLDSRATIDDLKFFAIEFAGEAGEVANVIKKLLRHLAGMKGGVSLPQSKQDIGDELADTIICADLIAQCLDINLSKAIKNKFNRTSRKHGFKAKL